MSITYVYAERGLEKSYTLRTADVVSNESFISSLVHDQYATYNEAYKRYLSANQQRMWPISGRYPNASDVVKDGKNLFLLFQAFDIELKEVHVYNEGWYTIPADAFAGCDQLVEVQLSEGARSIGKSAFAKTSLREIKLPNGIERIGPFAFERCKLEHIELPPTLTEIGEGAFDCCKLEHIELPPTLTEIGERAFAHCPLSDIELPGGLKVIGREAFIRTRLERVVLPPTLTEIGERAFDMLSEPPLTIYAGPDKHHPEAVRSVSGIQCKVVPLNEGEVRALALSRPTDERARVEATQLASSAEARGRCSTGEGILSDPDSLRRYLKAVSDAETQVFQLSGELSLALARGHVLETALENRKQLDEVEKKREKQRQQALIEAEKEAWEKERKAILAGKRLTHRDTGTEPTKPADPRDNPAPTEPERPTLAKPGFFNRRKVEESNARLEREYAEALARYESDVAERHREIERFETELEKYRESLKAYEERRSRAIEGQLKEGGFETFRSKIKAAKQADNPITVTLSAVAKANEAICGDLKSRLVEAAGLLKAAYSADVVFPKYRNLAAVTTMYEYLETGRCASLQGPDGAYNLYESELRSDAIIGRLDSISGKLDDISGKLDQIQQNQYVLYTAIDGANKRLDSMNQTMEEVLDVASETNSTVQQVSAKASAIVANSAEVAYWARKNAELTDSLGYLIAFTSM